MTQKKRQLSHFLNFYVFLTVELPEHLAALDAYGVLDIHRRSYAPVRKALTPQLSLIPEAARVRLQDILTKLVNKGKGNVIAIVL